MMSVLYFRVLKTIIVRQKTVQPIWSDFINNQKKTKSVSGQTGSNPIANLDCDPGRDGEVENKGLKMKRLDHFVVSSQAAETKYGSNEKPKSDLKYKESTFTLKSKSSPMLGRNGNSVPGRIDNYYYDTNERKLRAVSDTSGGVMKSYSVDYKKRKRSSCGSISHSEVEMTWASQRMMNEQKHQVKQQTVLTKEHATE